MMRIWGPSGPRWPTFGPWDFGLPVTRQVLVRAPGARQKSKNKGSSRFTWGGGKFDPPHASFVDQTNGFDAWLTSGVIGDKEKKGKEERGERKKREGRGKSGRSLAPLVCCRGFPRENPWSSSILRWFLVIFFHRTLVLCVGKLIILIS